MTSFSKTIVIGNLGADPELRYMPSGKPVASFSVCANEQYRKSSGEVVKTQTWFKANVYGNSAEAVSTHLRKGSPVYIEGRIRPELWDGRDGEKRFTLNLEAREIKFLGRKGEGAAPAATDETNDTNGGDLTDDDVPF